MLKIMTLWDGSSFYFHSSQEAKLLQQKLHARTVLLVSAGGDITEYRNADIPALWAQIRTCQNTGVNHADK